MKKIPFQHFVFHKSTLSEFPVLKDKLGRPLPEIVIAGRSNVGKSSLINHLSKQRHLAHVSAKPGKTITLNFFIVDDEIALVDLPGYGFAQRSKTDQSTWSEAIETYVQTRKELKLILLLIDSRRTLGPEDLLLIQWAQHNQKKLLLIFTKSDTLPPREREKNASLILEEVGAVPNMHYTIKDSSSRTVLIRMINELLWA